MIGSTISSPTNLIEETGKANFTLSNRTKFSINNALVSPNFKKNLLSLKDIYLQRFDTQSATEDGKK